MFISMCVLSRCHCLGSEFKDYSFFALIPSSVIMETKSSTTCPARSIGCTMAGTSYRMFIHPAFGSEKCKVCFRFWHVRYSNVSTAIHLKLVNHTIKVEPKITLQIFENTKAMVKSWSITCGCNTCSTESS